MFLLDLIQRTVRSFELFSFSTGKDVDRCGPGPGGYTVNLLDLFVVASTSMLTTIYELAFFLLTFCFVFCSSVVG